MSATVALFETKSVYPLGFTTTTSVRSPILVVSGSRCLPLRYGWIKKRNVNHNLAWMMIWVANVAVMYDDYLKGYERVKTDTTAATR